MSSLPHDGPVSKRRLVLGLAALLGLALLYVILSRTGALSILMDEQALRAWIGRLGFWGPAAIIALMVAAIVMSPIPSGPIAVAAGAAFGPLWGTLYVVIGSEAGALIAFLIARTLGYQFVRRRLGGRLAFLTRQRSQAALMGIVFASRLVPFISFDAVSYAAGLTPLAFWRFAVATLAGIIPISFALTYFGEEIGSLGQGNGILIAALLCGITVVPLVGKLLWDRYRRRRGSGKAVRDD